MAFELARRGLGVIVLDPGNGSSGDDALSSGLCAPQAAEAFPQAGREIHLLSRDLLEDWVEAIEEESGISCELDVRGAVAVATTDAEEVELDRALDWQRRRGLPVEPLTLEEIRDSEPALAGEGSAAFVLPRDANFAPVRLLAALRVAARGFGAELLEGVPVLAARPSPDGDGWALETPAGPFLGAAVVDAGGLAWDPAIEGLPAPVPLRATAVILDAASDPDRPRRPLVGGGARMVPRRDGTVLAFLAAERAAGDGRPTSAALADLLERTGRLAPAARDYPVIRTGAIPGWRAPDGLALLGESSRPGLFRATAFGVDEFGLAPAIGSLLALLLSGERLPVDLAPFAPDRFRA